MGILNITPDSFYSRSRYIDLDAAIKRGIEMYRQGADIIDIGGESTRPGSEPVSEKEEMDRVIPIISALVKEIPLPLSIDTMKPNVAQAAVECGASIINDVTGFSHPEMRQLAAKSKLPICVMHMHGSPKSMQENPFYPEGIVTHLIDFFHRRIELLLASGISQDQIILDPGIGFGKTVADNLEIIQNLRRLKDIGYPLLMGISRKSFLSKLLNKPAGDLLSATLAVSAIHIFSGIDYIRVHDVQEHRDAINVLEKIYYHDFRVFGYTLSEGK